MNAEPCPFCNSTNLSLTAGVVSYVYCNECRTDGPICNSAQEAVDTWNAALRHDTSKIWYCGQLRTQAEIEEYYRQERMKSIRYRP